MDSIAYMPPDCNAVLGIFTNFFTGKGGSPTGNHRAPSKRFPYSPYGKYSIFPSYNTSTDGMHSESYGLFDHATTRTL